MKLLFLLSLIYGWTPNKPPMSASAFHGPAGWHDERQFRDGDSILPINGAIIVCRNHLWTGYIQWHSALGTTCVDPCDFIRKSVVETMIGIRATQKQARILFNLPDSHNMEVIEERGKVSERLRKAIAAAEKTFNEVYNSKSK